ncbi:D-alanyl-D-alanine carboxypeptidase family protein [Mycolicibacterium litorale]|uniref:D-alanyl-D-alanine carboxypeptidase family protein n=1 Tax=Mycolicibacterium litorale TaxID=758802 RepID=UPI003CEEE3A0
MTPPAGTPSIEHWAFQIDSPFRGPAEIRELPMQSDGARGADLIGEWSESQDPFLSDFEQADEDEAYEEAETEGTDVAESETALAEADLFEETEATDHPLAAVFTLPRMAFTAMATGAWATAIAVAIGAGLRDVNKLTNMVFWFRHPQLIGQKLRADQRGLAREWVDIRDRIVRPALAGAAMPDTPSGPAAVDSPGGGGRTSIPAGGLRWYGPGIATPELMAFMRQVYQLHVERSEGNFVDTLPDSALAEIAPGHKARKDAALKARELLAAARAALEREGLAGTVRIGVLSAYRSADLQFAIWQGKMKKGKGGFPFYYVKTKSVRQLPEYGGEHSANAAEYLVDYMRRYVAAPGYSNHQDGLAIDFGTRKGEGALIKLYEGSWFHNWMKVNAKKFGFHPLASEAWHWTYRPPSGAREAESWAAEAHPPLLFEEGSQSWPAEATAASIGAGRLEVPKIPLLAAHRGSGPDVILRWNEMPSAPAEIDVVVHLHGYSWANMTLPKHMEVWAGLDLAPVDGAVGAGRTRPTLTVLPRGHFTGVKAGKIYRYTFPALTTKDGLNALVRLAIEQFAKQVGGSAPTLGRLILTAHSGGGAPLMQILRRHDPQEVHVFDGLYQDPTALAEWAVRHIKADRAAAQAGGAPSGAMRVFFGPSTRVFSTRLHEALTPLLRDSPTTITDRYRVESSRLGHWQIARQYGWRVLADAGADVPEAKRLAANTAPVKRLSEDESAEVPFLPEMPRLDEFHDSEDEDEDDEFDESESEGEDSPDFEDEGEVDLEFDDRFAPDDEALAVAEFEEPVDLEESESIKQDDLATEAELGIGDTPHENWEDETVGGVPSDVATLATVLGAEWSAQRKGSPTPQEMTKWLLDDYRDTLEGARKRWGKKFGKGTLTPEAVSQAWMVSRQENRRFQGGSQAVEPLGPFAPPQGDVRLVPTSLVEDSQTSPVAPLVVSFMKDLRGRYPGFMRAANYAGHGGGPFHNRGFSLDLYIAGRDDRGFYPTGEAVRFLQKVHDAATAVGAQWRVIYNDFTVADTVNRALGRQHIIFVGRTRKTGSRVTGLNWHGPAPLILHFHLDLAPLSGAASSWSDSRGATLTDVQAAPVKTPTATGSGSAGGLEQQLIMTMQASWEQVGLTPPTATQLGKMSRHGPGYKRYITTGLFVDDTAVALRGRNLLTISDDDIDMLQRASNVETGGKLTALNSWDSAFMSVGFMQWTLKYRKLQQWIALAPGAFERYGIQLEPTRMYAFSSSHREKAIVRAPRAADLRSAEWGVRFFLASLDVEAVVAEYGRALQISVEVRRAIVDPHGAAVVTHYNSSPVLRALVQETHNNRPAYMKQAMKSAAARAGTDTATFLEVVRREILRVYEVRENAPNKATNLITKTRSRRV